MYKILYTLNLQNVICQIYFSKIEKKISKENTVS